MSEDSEKAQPALRGEAAWKAAKAAVAARNDEASKIGKQRRAEYEHKRAKLRQGAEDRRMSELLRRQGER